MSGNKTKAGGRHGRHGAGLAGTGALRTDDRRQAAAWPPQLTAAPARELLSQLADRMVPAQGTPSSDAAGTGGASGGSELPAARRVLAVIARPGQESADLGAVLAAFALHGAQLAVLCLTRGEASEMNSTCERLEALRPWELRAAAGMLGVSSVTVADYPDGRLGYLPPGGLADHINRAARRAGADLLLVVDPAAAGDPDTAAVAGAAAIAGRATGLPVLARTVTGPGQRWRVGLGGAESDVRARQRRAIGAHRSQQAAGPAGMSGDGAELGPPPGPEMIRWLVAPQPVGEPAGAVQVLVAGGAADVASRRHRGLP